jgi:hypothetical protein
MNLIEVVAASVILALMAAVVGAGLQFFGPLRYAERADRIAERTRDLEAIRSVVGRSTGSWAVSGSSGCTDTAAAALPKLQADVASVAGRTPAGMAFYAASDGNFTPLSAQTLSAQPVVVGLSDNLYGTTAPLSTLLIPCSAQ